LRNSKISSIRGSSARMYGPIFSSSRARSSTITPPVAPRRLSTYPSPSSTRTASRTLARETSSRCASSRSGGSLSPGAYVPMWIARRSCSTTSS
jgi:hypothetical protein